MNCNTPTLLTRLSLTSLMVI
ncbi:protein of unknown function (plasmid) [Cupriavidus taiwanensis]|uniref:Uncharacterized protein n=1 Tax=Cupriavidus taiwanensis TaxID=164546 RepID=A0A7Z7JE94_9BURK|nr:protein of unknown function [Cupriavidus taiwanensis]SOZ42216.1 protein of unknown function [Cupriavidus taiwanensis]SPC21274.1 protein of unknown function [Cupriavidus taiwanensis]SPD55415.1 protein of unknown function [Cupriavidus taiwanensis]